MADTKPLMTMRLQGEGYLHLIFEDGHEIFLSLEETIELGQFLAEYDWEI